jgi:carboxymethylenebutenolidase
MSTSNKGYVFVEVGDGSRMALYVARPAEAKAAPVVIVLQEAFGLNGHIRDIADRCAREGYVAVAPELFHRSAEHGFEGSYDNFEAVMQHYQAVTDSGLEADLKATLQWLRADAQSDAGRVAALGFCMGGRAAFVANAVLPLGAAVAFYGGGIAPGSLSHAEQQHGPLLLVWGGLDTMIDLQQRRAVGDALRAAQKTFVELEYSDADHGFFCDQRASYHPLAATEAWALTVAFLRNRLA